VLGAAGRHRGLAAAERLTDAAPKPALLDLALVNPLPSDAQKHHHAPATPAVPTVAFGAVWVDNSRPLQERMEEWPKPTQPPTLPEVELLANAALGDEMWLRVRELYLFRLRADAEARAALVEEPLREAGTGKRDGEKVAWALALLMWLEEPADEAALKQSLAGVARNGEQEGIAFLRGLEKIRFFGFGEREALLGHLFGMVAAEEADGEFVMEALRSMAGVLDKMPLEPEAANWLPRFRDAFDEKLPDILGRAKSKGFGEESSALATELQRRLAAMLEDVAEAKLETGGGLSEVERAIYDINFNAFHHDYEVEGEDLN